MLDRVAAQVLAAQFRNEPGYDTFKDVFASESPRNLAIREIILTPGSPDYNTTIIDWLDQVPVADCEWNHLYFESYAEKLPVTERHRFIANYPLVARPKLLRYVGDALAADHFGAIKTLSRMSVPTRHWLFRQWAARNLHDLPLFLEAVEALASWPGELLPYLLQHREHLTELEYSDVLAAVALGLEPDGEGGRELLAWLRYEFELESPSVIEMAKIYLLGAFLGSPELGDEAVSLVASLVASRRPVDPLDLLHAHPRERAIVIVPMLIDRFRSVDLEFSVEAFHALAHIDLDAATKLSWSLLQSAEGSFRRGVIVILQRHGAQNATAELVEEAFAPGATRDTMFLYSYQYEDTPPGLLYQEIAGHGYRETGKQWPPVETDRTDRQREIRLWPEFLERYPYFPGTDDAYYRLSFLLLDAGKGDAALDRIDDFLSIPRSDYDALPYILRVAATALEDASPPPRLNRYIATRKLLRETNILELLTQGSPSTPALKSNLEWLENNPGYLRSTGFQPADIRLMRELLALLDQRLPLPKRLSKARDLLSSKRPALPILFTLGSSYELGIHPDDLEIRESVKGGLLSMKRLLREARSTNSCEGIVEWIQWLRVLLYDSYIYNSGVYLEDWFVEFLDEPADPCS